MKQAAYSIVIFEAWKHERGSIVVDDVFFNFMWVGYCNEFPPHSSDGSNIELLEDAIAVQAVTPDGGAMGYLIGMVGDGDVFQDTDERWTEISTLITKEFERQSDKPYLWQVSLITLWENRAVTYYDNEAGEEWDEEWDMLGVITEDTLGKLAKMIGDENE